MPGPSRDPYSQASSAPRVYLVTAEERLLCDTQGELMLLGAEALPSWQEERSPYSLGAWKGQQVAVLPLAAQRPVAPNQWLPLRSQLGLIDESLFALAGRGLQLERWCREHRFCGRCGGATELMEHGQAYHCPACDLPFYPRIAPCMITLVTRGPYCLLAKHAHKARPFYTALAGFVEPGESVEQTVHREIWEEVGLKVHRPVYFRSQPWPFPGQLMLGFHAEHRAGEIRVDRDEIDTAHWWHYRDLPQVPPPETLAGQLVAHFVAQQKDSLN